MKSLIAFIIGSMFMTTNIVMAQQTKTDSTGLPGDNFSLQGALQMFKESKSLEEFEKKLNTANNHVNNLDLDGNDTIDYIKVIDKTQGTSHAIVLQDAVNKTESQDVAVIEIEKNGKESAIMQIVGDEELYGDSVYVEPIDQAELKPGQKGPSSMVNNVNFVIVNVWLWPCVQYIYAPVYVPWVSPWRWHYYPVWWNPWMPLGWEVYHPYCTPYYAWYHPVYVHRVMLADNVYRPYRSTSVVVVNKYKPAHVQYNVYKQNHFQKPVNNNKPMNNQPNDKQVKGNPSNQKQMNNGKGNNKNPGNKKQHKGNHKQKSQHSKEK